MFTSRKLFLMAVGTIFAGGILFLSLSTNVKAHEDNGMGSMMRQHHGENWRNHHQQMHGSDSGT